MSSYSTSVRIFVYMFCLMYKVENDGDWRNMCVLGPLCLWFVCSQGIWSGSRWLPPQKRYETVLVLCQKPIVKYSRRSSIKLKLAIKRYPNNNDINVHLQQWVLKYIKGWVGVCIEMLFLKWLYCFMCFTESMVFLLTLYSCFQIFL